MKIRQNLETGKIEICLDAGEISDTEKTLQALMDFVSYQAVETYRHTKEYRRLAGRLDELEYKIEQLIKAGQL